MKSSQAALLRLLLAASEVGNIQAIEIALQEGAEINSADKFGITALHKAVHHRHKAAVEFLLRHGANPDQPNITGQTPRHWATTKTILGLIEKY